jgi:predicted nucleic-acid-binding protein
MTGLDTNLLVRLLVQDDRVQARAVERFLSESCTEDSPGFVNRIVLCELAWVLDRAYRCTREEIAGALDRLARMKGIRLEEQGEFWQALDVYRSGTAGFADAILAVTNRSRGCEETVTLDRRAAGIPGMRLLET